MSDKFVTILIMGVAGSGKTTIAEMLSKKINAILMTDANAWEVANFQSFPTTIFIEKNSVGKFVIDSINPSFNEIMDKIDDFGISGTGYTVGHIPYNFRFVDYNSPEMDSYSLYDFKGEYIILEIGALWCGACDTS